MKLSTEDKHEIKVFFILTAAIIAMISFVIFIVP